MRSTPFQVSYIDPYAQIHACIPCDRLGCFSAVHWRKATAKALRQSLLLRSLIPLMKSNLREGPGAARIVLKHTYLGRFQYPKICHMSRNVKHSFTVWQIGLPHIRSTVAGDEEPAEHGSAHFLTDAWNQ
jgi:hypothetical protein